MIIRCHNLLFLFSGICPTLFGRPWNIFCCYGEQEDSSVHVWTGHGDKCRRLCWTVRFLFHCEYECMNVWMFQLWKWVSVVFPGSYCGRFCSGKSVLLGHSECCHGDSVGRWKRFFLSFQRGQLILCFRGQPLIQSPKMTTRTNPNRRFRCWYIHECVCVLMECNLEVPDLCGGFDDY